MHFCRRHCVVAWIEIYGVKEIIKENDVATA